MTFLGYLFQVNIYLIIFGLFYMLMLRRETFHQLNRFYVLFSSILSLIIPVLKIKGLNASSNTADIVRAWSKIYVAANQSSMHEITTNESFSLGNYIVLFYFSISLLLFGRLIYHIILAIRLKTNSIKKIQAFSFFNQIYVDKDLAHFDTIYKHEQTHAKQYHSADIIFIELICVLNWFNPMAYFYKKEIKHLHEFIADASIIASGISEKKYSKILFGQSFDLNTNKLTNTFFNQSLLKRRIIMLNKKESKRLALFKYGLCTPIFLIAFSLSSFSIAESAPASNFITKTNSIVIKEFFKPIINSGQIKQQISRPITEKPSTMSDEAKNKEQFFSPLYTFLSRNLIFPADAKERGVVSKVLLRFEVGESGVISNYSVLKSTSIKSFENEVIRVMKKNKVSLDVEKGSYNLIFNFILRSDSGDITESQVINSTEGETISEVVIIAFVNNITPSNF
ncbi:TonB family protein [Pseudopedobacter saltans DSM 12145]|uniref:TonB family protein n=2 Tax=Pseudopedobacter saltans TaxID=151895 RepID=F0S7Q1_PSESL|nr:TonB family protein [Pseudopedobacter saltans DSM 12145]